MPAGRTMWTDLLDALFPVKELPAIYFAALQRARTPNQYLLAPPDLCRAAVPDETAPRFALAMTTLAERWHAAVTAPPENATRLRSDDTNSQHDYLQRSRLWRFPDIVTVRFIALGPERSTLAIYSRALYGRGDLGINRRRVRRWLGYLGKPEQPPLG